VFSAALGSGGASRSGGPLRSLDDDIPTGGLPITLGEAPPCWGLGLLDAKVRFVTALIAPEFDSYRVELPAAHFADLPVARLREAGKFWKPASMGPPSLNGGRYLIGAEFLPAERLRITLPRGSRS